MSSEQLKMVLELLRLEKANEAKKVFGEIAREETVEYFMVCGILEQKFQNWGKAINAFSKVVEIDSEHVEAKNHLQMINSILNFWNPEMFNP